MWSTNVQKFPAANVKRKNSIRKELLEPITSNNMTREMEEQELEQSKITRVPKCNEYNKEESITLHSNEVFQLKEYLNRQRPSKSLPIAPIKALNTETQTNIEPISPHLLSPIPPPVIAQLKVKNNKADNAESCHATLVNAQNDSRFKNRKQDNNSKCNGYSTKPVNISNKSNNYDFKYLTSYSNNKNINRKQNKKELQSSGNASTKLQHVKNADKLESHPVMMNKIFMTKRPTPSLLTPQINTNIDKFNIDKPPTRRSTSTTITNGTILHSSNNDNNNNNNEKTNKNINKELMTQDKLSETCYLPAALPHEFSINMYRVNNHNDETKNNNSSVTNKSNALVSQSNSSKYNVHLDYHKNRENDKNRNDDDDYDDDEFSSMNSSFSETPRSTNTLNTSAEVVRKSRSFSSCSSSSSSSSSSSLMYDEQEEELAVHEYMESGSSSSKFHSQSLPVNKNSISKSRSNIHNKLNSFLHTPLLFNAHHSWSRKTHSDVQQEEEYSKLEEEDEEREEVMLKEVLNDTISLDTSSNHMNTQNTTYLDYKRQEAHSPSLSSSHADQYRAIKNTYQTNNNSNNDVQNSKMDVKLSIDSWKNDTTKPHRGHSARQMIALHAFTDVDKVQLETNSKNNINNDSKNNNNSCETNAIEQIKLETAELTDTNSIDISKNAMSSKYFDDDDRIKKSKASHSITAPDEVDATQKVDESVCDVLEESNLQNLNEETSYLYKESEQQPPPPREEVQHTDTIYSSVNYSSSPLQHLPLYDAFFLNYYELPENIHAPQWCVDDVVLAKCLEYVQIMNYTHPLRQVHWENNIPSIWSSSAAIPSPLIYTSSSSLPYSELHTNSNNLAKESKYDEHHDNQHDAWCNKEEHEGVECNNASRPAKFSWLDGHSSIKKLHCELAARKMSTFFLHDAEAMRWMGEQEYVISTILACCCAKQVDHVSHHYTNKINHITKPEEGLEEEEETYDEGLIPSSVHPIEWAFHEICVKFPQWAQIDNFVQLWTEQVRLIFTSASPSHQRSFLCGQDELVFTSDFEGGNLMRVEHALEPFSYYLWLEPDLNSDKRIWFRFAICGAKAHNKLHFKLINAAPHWKLYVENHMMPVWRDGRHQTNWTFVEDCSFQLANPIYNDINNTTITSNSPTNGANCEVSFSITPQSSIDTIQVAFCAPYTYSDLLCHICHWHNLTKHITCGSVRFEEKILCRSVDGRKLHLLVITSANSEHMAPSSRYEKDYRCWRNYCDLLNEVSLRRRQRAESKKRQHGKNKAEIAVITATCTQNSNNNHKNNINNVGGCFPNKQSNNVEENDLYNNNNHHKHHHSHSHSHSRSHNNNNRSHSRNNHNNNREVHGPYAHFGSGKKVILVSGRVHPGEITASHAVHGLISFLLSSDDRAEQLREHFIFFIVPMINPDGVSRGHSRMDQFGDNLNRAYNEPNAITQPTVFALRKLYEHLQRTYAERFIMYLDFHSHASQSKAFMFGNCLPKSVQHWNLVFAKMVELHASSNLFAFPLCRFSQFHMISKDGASRVLFGSSLIHSYTVELPHFTNGELYADTIASVSDKQRSTVQLSPLYTSNSRPTSNHINNHQNNYKKVKDSNAHKRTASGKAMLNGRKQNDCEMIQIAEMLGQVENVLVSNNLSQSKMKTKASTASCNNCKNYVKNATDESTANKKQRNKSQYRNSNLKSPTSVVINSDTHNNNDKKMTTNNTNYISENGNAKQNGTQYRALSVKGNTKNNKSTKSTSHSHSVDHEHDNNYTTQYTNHNKTNRKSNQPPVLQELQSPSVLVQSAQVGVACLLALLDYCAADVRYSQVLTSYGGMQEVLWDVKKATRKSLASAHKGVSPIADVHPIYRQY